MDGVYISILAEKNIPDVSKPQIKREDLTRNILLLKDINIDIEELTDLPDMPDENSIKTSLDNLISIGAIDVKTLKITQFGHQILQFPFINIYYAASMSFFQNEYAEEDEKVSLFIAGYIATVLTVSNILLQEENSENLAKLFVKESDIATLIKALNVLLRSPITDNDKLRDLVESYGFSYSVFCDLKLNLQAIIDQSFPNKSIVEVLDVSDDFIQRNDGLLSVIDTFIYSIEQAYPNFTDSNYITFKYVNGTGGFDSHSTLVFNASKNLKFPKKRKNLPEININKRPGWNGITIPTECYLMNITRNLNFNTNSGYLIHRATPDSMLLISTIDLGKVPPNPYISVLFEIYFKDLKLRTFGDDDEQQKQQRNKRNDGVNRKTPFFFSNVGDRLFVSFMSEDPKINRIIERGANKIIKLLPFVPRSVLILRSDGNNIVEVMSLGTEKYNSQISTKCNGGILSNKDIDFCFDNIKELSKLDAQIRICTLIVNETCDVKYFDQNNLYIIHENYMPKGYICDTVFRQIQVINQENQKKIQSNRYFKSKIPKKDLNSDLQLFQFPLDFIHPALICHQESLDSILNWLQKVGNYKVVRVIGSRLLMNVNEIERLKVQIHQEKEQIKEQMNLNYVAIQIPLDVYEKKFIEIKEHQTWHYYKKYRTIVTTKDESKNVEQLINESTTTTTNGNDNDNNPFTDSQAFIKSTNVNPKALCCYFSCEDPDDPNLTKCPLTVFFKDGSYYSNRCCRECLIDHFKYYLGYLFVKGRVDQNKVEEIRLRPRNIPSIPSTEDNTLGERWPVIPLGLMCYILLNDDDKELSSYFSAWLYSIEEYTIRVLMSDRFLWCPFHPHYIYDIYRNHRTFFRCAQCTNQINLVMSGDEDALEAEIDKRIKAQTLNQINQKFGNLSEDEKTNPEIIKEIQEIKKLNESKSDLIRDQIKKEIQEMIRIQKEEDEKTKRYIQNLKKCPNCRLPIIKNGGCSHVRCACGCHFCWLCGFHSNDSPTIYNHLNNVHGSIYNDGDNEYD